MTLSMLLLLLLLGLCYPSLALSTIFGGTRSLAVQKRVIIHQPATLRQPNVFASPINYPAIKNLRGGDQPAVPDEQEKPIPVPREEQNEAPVPLRTDPPTARQKPTDPVVVPEEQRLIVEAPKEEQNEAPVPGPTDNPVLQEPSEAKEPILTGITAPMLSSLTALGKVYGTALEQRPIFTKSATAGIIFALSDYLAQRVEKSDDKRKTNWTRISASAIVGFAYFGPAAHAWYEMIFRLFPSTSLVSTLQKAALGQLIFGPIFTCVFFASALLQAGQFTPGAWLRKIRSDLPGAWAAGVGFWPLVDFVSYSMVPPQWIPLFVNFCSLIWTIYLSLVANRSKK